MYAIQVRRKHKIAMVLLVVGAIFAFYFGRWAIHILISKYNAFRFGGGPCSRHLRWAKPTDPLIGVLGSRGSGVQWLRFLIEQMTGLRTGSTHVEFPSYFKGEGMTEKVIAVLTYDMSEIKGMHAAIVLYRNMKDTIRAQYAYYKGQGAFLEAPLQSYYGNEWGSFALQKANEWAEQYQIYLDSGVPLLIMGYEELENRATLRKQLLKISHFLHVPIKSSTFECLLQKAHEFHLKPRSLRSGFQPFSLLPKDIQERLARIERRIERQISETRDNFLPKAPGEDPVLDKMGEEL